MNSRYCNSPHCNYNLFHKLLWHTFCYSMSSIMNWGNHIPSLHCTVIGFALDWESHKSLKHDHECFTELLAHAFFQPYPIQRIQPAEVGGESDDKGFERKRGWVVCINPFNARAGHYNGRHFFGYNRQPL